MESDEKYIRTHFGKEQHFVAPDGYLGGLANSILDNVTAMAANQADVPTQIAAICSGERMPLWQRWRKVVAVACLLLACGGTVAFFTMHDVERKVSPVVSHNSVESATYTYDEIADFSMLDNEDIYSLVASN